MQDRTGSFRETVQPLVREAATSYRDLRRLLAHAGVAVFSISLLLPMLMHAPVREVSPVLLAATFDEITPAAIERVTLPNTREAVATPEPTPAPTPEPTPEPAPAPTPFALAGGGPGVFVLASWYGPGFYGNRLPCWQWLLASGKPIQFEADTWGVANKSLPCGTMLVLTHGANTVTVPVVDRGPYVAGRELDLSPAVKAALGCTDLCSVLMRIP